MLKDDIKPLTVPRRLLEAPRHLSDLARSMLVPFSPPMAEPYPDLGDADAWRRYVTAMGAAILPMYKALMAKGRFDVETLDIDGTRVFVVTPEGVDPDDRTTVFDMHGGALVFCAGDIALAMAKMIAARLKRRVWSVDYRMAPDHPFPAALEDGQKAYRALLEQREPGEIIMLGLSAGGNLIPATLLKCCDEGMPLPAALVLQTPELDLTESGDSFRANDGVDHMQGSLMPVNLLYADGHDLTNPYVSPLFGNFAAGFPPTLLTAGTRYLFLSNAVRMHRALRAADIPAELHVMEAAPHGNLDGTEECEAIDKDVREFIRVHLS